MALNAKTAAGGGGPKFDPMEAGTYPARLVQVIDLGVQKQKPFKGQEKPPVHMIQLTYEFVDEFLKDEDGNDMEDKPRWLSEDMPFYNLEADRAKSTQRYYALDPNMEQDGDFTALVGTPVMVTVVNNWSENKQQTYSNIGAVSTMRDKEAKKCPDLVNPPKVFVLDEPDMEVFFSLPEWLQDKIKGNLEFEGSTLQTAIENHKGSDDKEKGSDEDTTETDDNEEDW